MRDHWGPLRDLVVLMIEIIARNSDGRAEIQFLQKRPITVQPHRYCFDAAKVLAQTCPFDNAVTSLSHSLQQEFEKVVNELDARRTPHKKTLYVLTDGLLEERESDVDDTKCCITSFVEKLFAKSVPDGCVGIQFVSFGESDRGMKRLMDFNSLCKYGKLPM
jgi:hypothetical protein